MCIGQERLTVTSYFLFHFLCYRRNFLSQNSISSTRKLSTATDEKSAAPELSENEQKLATEVESLTKDVAGLKEKCSELDVSNFELNCNLLKMHC